MITVNPAHTSQTCHECETADSRNCKSQAGFHYVTCRHSDPNAAANTLASGIRAFARRKTFASATLATREVNAEAA